MVRKFIAVLALTSGLALAACNTVEGMGEDVESVGQKTQDVAN